MLETVSLQGNDGTSTGISWLRQADPTDPTVLRASGFNADCCSSVCLADHDPENPFNPFNPDVGKM